MTRTKELLKPMAEDGAALTREQAAEVLTEILSGQVPEIETAALLTVMATRGEQAPGARRLRRCDAPTRHSHAVHRRGTR